MENPVSLAHCRWKPARKTADLPSLQWQWKYPLLGEALGILPILSWVSFSNEGDPFPSTGMVEMDITGLSPVSS